MNLLAIAAMAATGALGPVSGPVHDGPYTYTPAVQAPAAGYASDLVTFHGSMCRGATRYAAILVTTDAGGEESEPGTVRAGHVSFRLLFGPGDRGTWRVGGVTVACADGSWGQYWGRHPAITVY